MLGLARLHKLLHIESLFGRCWSWACRRFQTRKHDRRRHLSEELTGCGGLVRILVQVAIDSVADAGHLQA